MEHKTSGKDKKSLRRNKSFTSSGWESSYAASQKFKSIHDNFRSNPIQGLDQQHQTYKHIRKMVNSIREKQQEIFLDQFKQFPAADKAGRPDDYTAIQDSFEDKDMQVTNLARKLNELTKHIDEVNKLSDKLSGTD